MVRRRAGRKRKQGVARKADNRIKTSEYVPAGPTPEAMARRETLLGSRTATGEVDCVLDILASTAQLVLTEKQAEAGRRYTMARLAALRAAGISAGPKSPRLTDWIDRGGVALPPGDDDGKAAFRWRKARQCVFDCGSDVRRIVDRVCIDNATPRMGEIARLRIGLDALVRLWRL